MSNPACKPVRAIANSAKPTAAVNGSCATSPDIPALNALALRSLVSLYNEKDKLFHRSIAETEDGYRRKEPSLRRTVIALLGLHRLSQSGDEQPFDLALLQENFLARTNWVSGVGDLGLLTWLTAECDPERLPDLLCQFDFDNALKTYPDGRQARTRALAWFLAGISHSRLSGSPLSTDLTDTAVDTYHALLDNQGDGGIFCEAVFPGLLQRAFCRRFGTFADQIFAIYALSTFAKAFQVEEPLSSALSCANSMRALQGDLGEWWFLYDKQACRVANRYPVLSFHQDGTAPVGLRALEEATGQNFSEPIYKGLSWVMGANALGNDLRNLEKGLIWDCIQPRRQAMKYWDAALSLANIPTESRKDCLKIRHEACPDHFGWLLYAFGRSGLPKAEVEAGTESAG